MEIKTHRLTSDALTRKTDNPRESKSYHALAYPLRIILRPGTEGEKCKITYHRYHAHSGEDVEMQLFPALDREPGVPEKFMGCDPMAQYYRSIRQYEAEELQLEQEHNVPGDCVEPICRALQETLQGAIAHLEMLGITGCASRIIADVSIDCWLTKDALRRVNSEDDPLEYHDLIRVTCTGITYNYHNSKILA